MLLFVFGLVITLQAQTLKEEIKTLLEQRDQQVKTLLGPKGSEYSDEQRAEIKDIINGVIDFESMAKYALEDTYDTLSTEIQTEFVELFATIVRDQLRILFWMRFPQPNLIIVSFSVLLRGRGLNHY